MYPLVNAYLGRHIIGGEHPIARWQLSVFLHNLHIFNKVYVGTFGQRHLTLLYMKSRVGQHIQVATETKVLLVVRNKLEMITQIAIYIHGIGNIITIERHGCLAYRTGKPILQQIVYTLRACTLDNVFHILGVFAIYVLSNGFVNRNRKYQLIVIRTHLYLIKHPLLVLKASAIKVGRFDIIHS